jgi:GWxTD domain-containing protein
MRTVGRLPRIGAMMPELQRRSARFVSMLCLIGAACGGSGGGRPAPAAARTPAPQQPPQSSVGPQFDQVKLYQQLGLLARGAPMPFVGSVAFLATASSDSTHAILAVTLSNAALTFARENDRFRAGYTVGIVLSEGGATVKQFEAHESVLVPSFKETSRIDESVIYQELLTLRPGRYSLALTVRDDGSSRGSTENVTLAVPVLGPGTIGSPVSFARAIPRLSVDSLPRIISSPAATATFGRDSIVGLYLEAYGPYIGARAPLHVAVRTEDGRTLFSDTVSLAWRVNLYSGTLYLGIARLGIGPAMVSFWRTGGSDTTRTPVFVGFGEDLPVATYDEMINYLRWFAAPYKLKALRDTTPEYRAAAWASFVAANSSIMGGSEALRDYFRRFAAANLQFREEGMPGWMTDRGKVLLGLGEPDQRTEPTAQNFAQRNRIQIWEYRDQGIQLTFTDQSGFGRWRLVTTSNIAFESAWRRKVQQ